MVKETHYKQEGLSSVPGTNNKAQRLLLLYHTWAQPLKSRKSQIGNFTLSRPRVSLCKMLQYHANHMLSHIPLLVVKLNHFCLYQLPSPHHHSPGLSFSLSPTEALFFWPFHIYSSSLFLSSQAFWNCATSLVSVDLFQLTHNFSITWSQEIISRLNSDELKKIH